VRDLNAFSATASLSLKSSPLNRESRPWSAPLKGNFRRGGTWINGFIQKSVEMIRVPAEAVESTSTAACENNVQFRLDFFYSNKFS
jgi:hypothetical protein